MNDYDKFWSRYQRVARFDLSCDGWGYPEGKLELEEHGDWVKASHFREMVEHHEERYDLLAQDYAGARADAIEYENQLHEAMDIIRFMYSQFDGDHVETLSIKKFIDDYEKKVARDHGMIT